LQQGESVERVSTQSLLINSPASLTIKCQLRHIHHWHEPSGFGSVHSNICGKAASIMTGNKNNDAYWRANVRLMLILLAIWFTVSFGFGILLVDWLNQFQFFGFKFGFWWAQQGAIYVFVILVFVYTAVMRRIDRKFGVSDEGDH
jgi:putative solute:sodium symporter small subunit